MADNNDAWNINSILSLDRAGEFLAEQIGKIPDEVRKINAALLDLSQASNTTLSGIQKHFDSLTTSAQRLGVSVTDIIQAAATWARMGYNLSDAKKLAETTLLYTNTADDLSMDNAIQLVAGILQEYELKTDDAMMVIDQIYALSKSAPNGVNGMTESLLANAPSLHAAGADSTKSLALITGADRIIPDSDATDHMWSTLSARILNARQELEAVGEDTEGLLSTTSELGRQVKELTGFDMMVDSSETKLKDIYDIIVGIGAQWDHLNETQQDGLLEILAGSQQSDNLHAVLDNISVIQDAYLTAVNSSGSALAAQEVYEEGVQYSFDRLSSSFQTFAAHILDSRILKGIVDLGNGAVNAVDAITNKINAAGTIGLGAGLIAGIKNIGKCRMSVRISNHLLYMF